jgi:hypothetical protein
LKKIIHIEFNLSKFSMYINSKMIPVETTPGIGRRG